MRIHHSPSAERLSRVRRVLQSARAERLARVHETPMNGLDIATCMEAATKADPKRGRKWVKVFGRVAIQLGYRRIPGIATHLEHERYGK